MPDEASERSPEPPPPPPSWHTKRSAPPKTDLSSPVDPPRKPRSTSRKPATDGSFGGGASPAFGGRQPDGTHPRWSDGPRKPNNPLWWILGGVAGAFFLVTFTCCGFAALVGQRASQLPSHPTARGNGPELFGGDGVPAEKEAMAAGYQAIEIGDSMDLCVNLLGDNYTESSRNRFGDIETVMLTWKGPGFSTAVLMFQKRGDGDHELVSKSQFGLE